MRVIVSDTSCLIDLRKADLLEAFIRTPYEKIIPDILYDQEIVKFTQKQRHTIERGINVRSLPGTGVERAIEVAGHNPALTIHDCFALVLAESTNDSILLTGDNTLRRVASGAGLEVHGMLWVLEEIRQSKHATLKTLIKTLELFRDDSTIHLPPQEMNKLLSKYRQLLK